MRSATRTPSVDFFWRHAEDQQAELLTIGGLKRTGGGPSLLNSRERFKITPPLCPGHLGEPGILEHDCSPAPDSCHEDGESHEGQPVANTGLLLPPIETFGLLV